MLKVKLTYNINCTQNLLHWVALLARGVCLVKLVLLLMIDERTKRTYLLIIYYQRDLICILICNFTILVASICISNQYLYRICAMILICFSSRFWILTGLFLWCTSRRTQGSNNHFVTVAFPWQPSVVAMGEDRGVIFRQRPSCTGQRDTGRLGGPWKGATWK